MGELIVQECGCNRRRIIGKERGPQTIAYLIRVHFKLSDDFDGDLIVGVGISCFVDVAEGTITHLFQQDVSFEARVSRELIGLFSLLGDNGLNLGLSIFVDFLILGSGMSGGIAGLSDDIAIVDGSSRVFTGLRLVLILRLSLGSYGF